MSEEQVDSLVTMCLSVGACLPSAPLMIFQFSRFSTSVQHFRVHDRNRVSPRFRLRQRPLIGELILTIDSESSVHPQIFVGSASEDPVQPAGKPNPAMGSTITIAAAVIS